MMSNLEIQITLEGIKNQYSIGPELVQAIEKISDQAIAANMLAEENQLLKISNDRMKTALVSYGIMGFL